MDEVNDPFCHDCKKKHSECQCKMDPKVVEFFMKNKAHPKIFLLSATPMNKTKNDFETLLDMLQGIDRRCHPIVRENEPLPKEKVDEDFLKTW